MNSQRDRNEDQTILAAIFRRRAQKLAQRGRQDIGRRAGVPVLVLRTAGERFGIELVHVERVFARVDFTPVPGSVPALIGVANIDGAPRSVFDLARLLNLQPSISATSHVVLLRSRGKVLGLAVEAADEIQLYEPDELMSVDEATGNPGNRFTKGVTDSRLRLLDADALFDHALGKREVQRRDGNALACAPGQKKHTNNIPARAPGPQERRER